MLTFTHDTLAQRVLFGTGEAVHHLGSEVTRFGAQAVMLIADDDDLRRVPALRDALHPTVVFDDVLPHVPAELADNARRAAVAGEVDLLVSLGGGSATGLAKAVALHTGIPIVAIPTTYAGSEATNVWGITTSNQKQTGVDARVLPKTVIYDAELTFSLPAELSVASGLNALAHCVDSMWAPRTDPINQAMAAEGIRALSLGLPVVKADPRGREGREQALYGAYLSAVAFASAGSGMHHKICHVLGGAYNLPHAHTHAVILPYVLAFLAPAAPAAADRIATAFSSPTATAGLTALQRRLDAPTALKPYGFDESMVNEAAHLILPAIPASTPRPVTVEDLVGLLSAACAGTPPIEEARRP